MSAKSLVVLAFWVVAVVLFAVVGFDIADSADFNLVALGLASFVTGEIVDHFWTAP